MLVAFYLIHDGAADELRKVSDAARIIKVHRRGGPATTSAQAQKKQQWNGIGMKILRQVLTSALAEPQQVKKIRPWADGSVVKAVDQEVLRDPFYRSLSVADETDPVKINNKRRQEFKRAIDKATERNLTKRWEMTDTNQRSVRYIWLLTNEPPPQGEPRHDVDMERDDHP